MNDIMKPVGILTMILLIVGGINWGLVGLMNFDLVNALFHSIPVLKKVVYILVGVSALVQAVLFLKNKKAPTA